MFGESSENKTDRIIVTITPIEKKALARLALAHRMTLSELVRLSIQEYVERQYPNELKMYYEYYQRNPNSTT